MNHKKETTMTNNNEDRTFNVLRRVPFEELEVMKYLFDNGGVEASLNTPDELWELQINFFGKDQDINGWTYEDFKAEWKKRGWA